MATAKQAVPGVMREMNLGQASTAQIADLYKIAQARTLDSIPSGFQPYFEALKSGKSVTWFDFETTGLNIMQGDIPTEIATMTLHPSGKVTHFSTILQTGGRPVSPEGWKIAQQYGGITREMMEAGMPLGEAAQKLKGIIGEGVIAGQNIKAFDVPFMQQLFNRAGIEAPAALYDERLQFDMLHAMRKASGEKFDSYSMSAVEQRLGLFNPDQHRALADVWTELNAAHKIAGLPGTPVPRQIFERLRGTPVGPAADFAEGVRKKAATPKPPKELFSSSERSVLKGAGHEALEHAKGFGKTLMGFVKKHPYMAAGAALVGGAMIIDKMNEARRRPAYSMQITPAQMNQTYHRNRVYV